MPIHDWSRVESGIVHAFHHGWITEITRALNRELLPSDIYALPEQRTNELGPMDLTLHGNGNEKEDDAETDMAYYRRKQKFIAVRHATGDGLVAMIEIVSPGNKSSRNHLRAFAQKAAELLDRDIHLLILDLQPPGKRDPNGIHNEIWDEISGEEYTLPADKPLTLASYESGSVVRAYVVQAAVGDALTDMPLFLEPEQAVTVPLEATYTAAFNEIPRRWRRVLEMPKGGTPG